MGEFYRLLPPEGAKIIVVLFLSFLIGIEREEHRSETTHYLFGGVRTFPLIGLIGYVLALISGGQLMPVMVGFAIVAAFLIVSYRHKLSVAETAGVTTEIAGLTTYLVGVLVYKELFWIATTLSVVSMLLLELKFALENLTKRMPPGEILTFAKFMLLSAVILPVLPNKGFGRFAINPFKTWLVVVAVSTVSYGSYVIQKLIRDQGGLMLTGILGGAYSSTVATVVLAKRSKTENRPHLFSGTTLVASGMMYLRLAILVGLFNRGLLLRLGPPFLALAVLAGLTGWFWSRMPEIADQEEQQKYLPANPLEMRAAVLFALFFIAILIVTQLAITYLGRAGVFSLAAIMGVTDVDPFIMGMTQAGGSVTPLQIASAAILIAAASNNVVKGIYAYTLSDRKTGHYSLMFLVGLAIVGLIPLLWLLI